VHSTAVEPLHRAMPADAITAERQQRIHEAKAQAQRREQMAASMRGLLDALSGPSTPPQPASVASPPTTAPLDPEITDIAELLQKLKTIEHQQVATKTPAAPKAKKPRKKRSVQKPPKSEEKRKAWGAPESAATPTQQRPASATTERRPASATLRRPASAKLRRPASATYERGATGRRGSLPTRRPPPSPQLASPSPSAPSRLYSNHRSGSSIRLSGGAAASGGRLSQFGAAFDISMSAHKRHNNARQASLLRASVGSAASDAAAPSGNAMHRISRGQSVVVTPLNGAKHTQRKQGKAISEERVVSIRNTLSELCHEYPFGMVSVDHLEAALGKLNLSAPEFHTYRGACPVLVVVVVHFC
jgi:hypothetical protein